MIRFADTLSMKSDSHKCGMNITQTKETSKLYFVQYRHGNIVQSLLAVVEKRIFIAN
jgi:hypothetical protein